MHNLTPIASHPLQFSKLLMVKKFQLQQLKLMKMEKKVKNVS